MKYLLSTVLILVCGTAFGEMKTRNVEETKPSNLNIEGTTQHTDFQFELIIPVPGIPLPNPYVQPYYLVPPYTYPHPQIYPYYRNYQFYYHHRPRYDHRPRDGRGPKYDRGPKHGHGSRRGDGRRPNKDRQHRNRP